MVFLEQLNLHHFSSYLYIPYTEYVISTQSAGAVDPPISPAPYSGGVGSDDEKTIKELQEMLATSMTSRDKAETEKMVGVL